MHPLVSIVISCYNYGQFVAQAIESSLGQSYKNIEVIVVNDGSNDNSDLIIRRFGSRVSYISQKNKGVVAARNNGAELARGEFIVFLDADDYLPEDFIEKSVKALIDHPDAAFVYGDQQVIGSRQFVVTGRLWDKYQLRVINYIGLTTLMRKVDFDEVGGFDFRLNKAKGYEDWDLWLKLSRMGKVGLYNPSIFFFYRKQHEGNRNRASAWQKMQLRIPIMQKYWSLYISPQFLIRLPVIVVNSLTRKLSVVKDN